MLQPLDVPQNCWEEVTADFVSKFPTSPRGHDMVLFIVDRSSKRAIFVPTNENIFAMDATALFQEHLFSKDGVPIRLVPDGDPKFKSKYWRGPVELINVKLNMSTADHPETDGQSENMIRTLSNMIRGYIQTVEQD